MRIKNRYGRVIGSKYQRIVKKKIRWFIPEAFRESLRKSMQLYLKQGIHINAGNFNGMLSGNPL